MTVQLQDAAGNPVSFGGTTITLSLTSGNGTLSGTTSQPTNASGLATFADLSIDLAGSKVLTAASAGLTSAVSSAFSITAATATQLAYVQQPTDAAAGATIAPAVTVQLQDAGANPVAIAGTTITLSLTSGNGTLSGTVSRVTNASGLATFSDLSIDLAGSKQLTAAGAGLTSAVSSSFTITAGPASQLAYVQPPTPTAPGATITPAVTVQLQDAAGNPVSFGGTTITLSLTSGNGTLSGTTSQPTNASGLATFADLSIDLAGSKVLTAASAGLTSAVSSAFSITAATATQLAYVQQPTNAAAEATIAPAVTVQLQDAGANPVAIAGTTITLTLTSGNGTLSGTASRVTNASGLATFDDLSIDLAGSKVLTAASAGLTSAVSSSFTITAGPAASIVVTGGSPQFAVFGAAFPSPLLVTVTDSAGNPVSGVTVTFLAPASGPSAILSNGGIATTNASGRASVTATANGMPGGPYIVTASVGQLTAAEFSLTNLAAAASATIPTLDHVGLVALALLLAAAGTLALRGAFKV
ncbi:MAG: IPTL-CTERM sorting domain-containing protein [Holophagales bacterium]|nr:IPTL-CTERM sorting domain-containing protein [Holophagales bacterium]